MSNRSILTGLALAATLTGVGTVTAWAQYEQSQASEYPVHSICRATIATLKHQDIRDVSSGTSTKGLTISYVAPDSGVTKNFQCQIDSDAHTVAWAADGGKWHKNQVSYSVDQQKQLVIVPDGGQKAVFTPEQLDQ